MNNWQRIREQILDNYLRVPHEASDKAQYAERKSEGFLLIACFVDASIAAAKSEGMEPDPQDTFGDLVREQMNEAANIAHEIVFAFQLGKHDAIFLNKDVSEQKVKEAFKLSYGVPSHYLLAEAKLGRRLLVDKDSLEEAIGHYLSNNLRPTGVDRLLVLSLTDMEISSYLAEMLDETRIIGQSPIQILRGLRHPVQAWLTSRVWRFGLLVSLIAGVFFVSSQTDLSPDTSILVSIGFIAVFLLDVIFSLVKLPFQLKHFRAAHRTLTKNVVDLPALMHSFYTEFRTSGPISVKRLRAKLEDMEQQGVVWPSSLWPLIEDIEKRSIIAL